MIQEQVDNMAVVSAIGSSGVDVATASLLEWSVAQIGSDEFARAKQEFFDQYGKVFPEESIYDAWMDYFANVCMFERPTGILQRQTPFAAWRLQHVFQSRFSSAELHRCVSGLSGYVHSLFEIKKVADNHLEVRDLWDDQSMRIASRMHERTDGLHKGEIFQGFLLYFEDDLYLGGGLVIHPRQISGIIRQYVTQHGKNPQNSKAGLLVTMTQVFLRHLRHRHVSAEQIYRARLQPSASRT